jgi:hydroxyethylthiazole kinase-like uncharacterized protein yjeF
MKLVSVSEMHAVEQEADSAGLTYNLMMENAGHNLAHEVMELAYSQNDEEDVQVLGLVGPGNNGGDTLVALTHLAEKGWTARAYLVKRKAKNDPLVKRLEDADGEVYTADDDEGFHQLLAFIETADVFLDGVLGTGFKLPLREDVGRVLDSAQGILAGMEWPPFIVAVDCPSGADCDTGQAAAQVIPADATVTMAAVKQGLLKLPAYGLAGELRVVDIGPLDGLKSWQALRDDVADEALVAAVLPQRGLDSHKGTFGTAVIAAGSLNYTGAAARDWSRWLSPRRCTPPSPATSPKPPGCSCRTRWASSPPARRMCWRRISNAPRPCWWAPVSGWRIRRRISSRNC